MTIVYKKISKTRIFRFLAFFSKIWKIGERYKADKVGDKTKSYSTPTSKLKNREEKLFERY